MTIEKRIEKLVIKMIPFRDQTCLIKTLEDKAQQARKYKEIWSEIKDWRFEQQQDYVYGLEEEYKNNNQSI